MHRCGLKMGRKSREKPGQIYLSLMKEKDKAVFRSCPGFPDFRDLPLTMFDRDAPIPQKLI
jgi:hypothetical protein